MQWQVALHDCEKKWFSKRSCIALSESTWRGHDGRRTKQPWYEIGEGNTYRRGDAFVSIACRHGRRICPWRCRLGHGSHQQLSRLLLLQGEVWTHIHPIQPMVSRSMSPEGLKPQHDTPHTNTRPLMKHTMPYVGLTPYKFIKPVSWKPQTLTLFQSQAGPKTIKPLTPSPALKPWESQWNLDVMQGSEVLAAAFLLAPTYV